jgi:hypothetical protein
MSVARTRKGSPKYGLAKSPTTIAIPMQENTKNDVMGFIMTPSLNSIAGIKVTLNKLLRGSILRL